MMDFGTTQKVLAICQLEEISISSRKSLVLWLYVVFKRHPHGKRKNQNYKKVA